MDGFTLGVLIKALLASAGVRNTVILLTLGAFLYSCYKAVGFIAGFFERLIQSRDAMIAQLTRDMKASDERRAAIERETTAILSSLHTKIDTNIAQHDDTKRDIGQIKDSLNVLKGAVS